MGTVLITDTHGFVEDLKAGGFTGEQAETLTKVLNKSDLSQLATKNDLQQLKIDLMKWQATIVGIGVAILALLKFI